jgi:hypothetical protein
MKKAHIIAGVCGIGLVGIFTVINPQSAPSFVLILPFVLLAVLMYLALIYLFELQGISLQKRRRIAVLCTGLPMSFLVMQSIGQLTLRDVATISIVFLLSYFYILRMTSATLK